MKTLLVPLSLLLPSIGWAACFSEPINALANSGKTYQARVIANQALSHSACKLTLKISGTTISGEASDQLCRVKKDDSIKLMVRAFCCETPPCENNRKTKIWFFAPRPTLDARSPVTAESRASLLNPLLSAPSGRSPPSATASRQPQTRSRAIAARAPITAAGSATMGSGAGIKKGSTTSIETSKPPGQKTNTANDTPGTEAKARKRIPPPTSLDRYKVELGVDEGMKKPGPPGELKVWIGDPALSAGFGADMATAQTTIAAVGQSARVTPYAPDFTVAPKESLCMKIHPSGSEVRFALTPKATGTFKVGADVLLYASEACAGTPVPKSAASLKVEVVVNKEGVAKNYLLQLWEILWQGILDFWQWLVATVFGLLIFLTRKHLKKWFGLDA